MSYVNGHRLYTQAIQQLQSLNVRQALRLFDRAEQARHDPDSCAAGRWDCHMLSGDFERAWQESDAIAARGNHDPHRFWDGRPFVDRHIIIRCLHGLGDTLQFIRYVPLLREKARSVTLEAQPTLKPLLSIADLADSVITWSEPEPHWDQQIEVIELPRIFRTTLDTIPNRVPYLNIPSTAPLRINNTPQHLRVGLVWGSSSYNPERSIPLRALAPLLDTPKISFFSLQAGPHRAELQPWSTRIPSLYDESACVLAMAKTLSTLDLVITVDTMMAHLAGAMSRPVWTLLPYYCDWRWMLGREDSPWYPSMRLFRQARPGDWKPVVRQLQRALNALVSRPNPAPQRSNPMHLAPALAPEAPEA